MTKTKCSPNSCVKSFLVLDNTATRPGPRHGSRPSPDLLHDLQFSDLRSHHGPGLHLPDLLPCLGPLLPCQGGQHPSDYPAIENVRVSQYFLNHMVKLMGTVLLLS